MHHSPSGSHLAPKPGGPSSSSSTPRGSDGPQLGAAHDVEAGVNGRFSSSGEGGNGMSEIGLGGVYEGSYHDAEHEGGIRLAEEVHGARSHETVGGRGQGGVSRGAFGSMGGARECSQLL